ncbi:MAG: alpha/beta hydrolase family protein [Candidatus Latescibacterota bacterium]
MPILLPLLIACLVYPIAAECQILRDIEYLSSADNSPQHAMFFAPDGKTPVPLIVALHTWSGDYKQDTQKALSDWCIKNGWAYIHPDFRGPNLRPQATGSELVVEDIVSAVEYAKSVMQIDSTGIFLVGASGGGYTALLMAGRRPEIWAGVSAWVPISDLTAWYHESKAAGNSYYQNIADTCGGAPGESGAVDGEYRKRSPLTWLANAKGVPLHINAGIHDGHTGSVPVSHSLRAFNAVAAPEGRLSNQDIQFFVEKEAVPPHLAKEITDPDYGQKKPLFRSSSGAATVTIFQGGHEMVPGAALSWIESIYKNRKGR